MPGTFGECPLGPDHMHDGVDQGEVHQARRVVAHVPARPGIELLRVHASELAEETNRSQRRRARPAADLDRAKLRNWSSSKTVRATPTREEPPGSSPRRARARSAGSSFLVQRSPDAPNTTIALVRSLHLRHAPTLRETGARTCSSVPPAAVSPPSRTSTTPPSRAPRRATGAARARGQRRSGGR